MLTDNLASVPSISNDSNDCESNSGETGSFVAGTTGNIYTLTVYLGRCTYLTQDNQNIGTVNEVMPNYLVPANAASGADNRLYVIIRGKKVGIARSW